MASITIRDVPEPVRAKLAARAAAEGRSMQQFLVLELTRLVAAPTNREVFDRARRRAQEAGLTITTSEILDALAADRR